MSLVSTQPIALSVIIPCYNQGEFLLDALSSVQACHDPVYEIIIVNDGSNDPLTINLFNYLKEQGYFILDQENQGLARARNNGIDKASGRYILPLDADNKIRTDYILKSIEILDQESDIDIVYGKPNWFGDIERSWEMPEDFDASKLILGNYIDACAVYRKSVWEKCGGYDPYMPIPGFEDWDFWLSAIEQKLNFHYIPEILFDYRVRETSMITACGTPGNRSKLLKYICTKHASLYNTNFAAMISDRELRIGSLEEHSNNLARQKDELEKTLTQVQTQLQTQLQDHFQQVQHIQTELGSTQVQLRETQAELQQAQTELGSTQVQLQEAQAELQQTQQRHQAMESSKFWKLRNVWFRLKQRFGSTEAG